MPVYYQPIAEAARRAVLEDAAPAATIRCLNYCRLRRRLLSAATGCSRSLKLRRGTDRVGYFRNGRCSLPRNRKSGSAWVVGSNANLPVLPRTLDRVLCMFGFPVYAEFARVLKADGQLVQVDAGSDHLRELREIIYPVLKPERTSEIPVPPGFTRAGE